MLVSQFMETEERMLSVKSLIRLSIILGGIGLFIMIFGGPLRGLGSLMVFTAILFWMYKYFMKKWANAFQRTTLPWLEERYKRFLNYALSGWKPFAFFGGTFLLLFVVFALFGVSIGTQRTSVEFFPDNKPNQIVVYIEYPQGTDIEKTNTVTRDIEKRVYAVLNDKQYFEGDHYNFMVESAVSQVGEGAGNPQTDGGSAAEMPHRGKITATLREFKFRKGKDSEVLRKRIQETLKGIYPGVAISVEKDPVGPPVGYPINI
jgi:multidrug efflux pump